MLDSKLKTKEEAKEASVDAAVIEKIRKDAKRVLLRNYEATGKEYITPAWPHYKNQWVWDSVFHAISCVELGMKDLAINEIRNLFKFQDERGFIPHRIYHGNFVWFDLERPLYNRGGWKPESSSLVGQPVIAQAVEAIDDDDFTREVIEGLVKFYMYFLKYRDAANIISIISPRESGRDAAPEFDFFRPSAPRKLWFLEKFLDPMYVLRLHNKYGRKFKLEGGGWDEKKILGSRLFNVKDIAIHCLWIDGLYSLRNLLKKVDREELFPEINEVIRRARDVLIEKAWDEEDEAFYPLRVTKQGEQKIKMLSLGSLFPLLIRDLPPKMVHSIVWDITDPEKFWTPYPIPVVPKCNEKFEPITALPIWDSGEVWINANWCLLRGLMQHNCLALAQEIAVRNIKMIEKSGIWEIYNTLTGEGMRISDFGWSTLVTTFPKLVSLDK